MPFRMGTLGELQSLVVQGKELLREVQSLLVPAQCIGCACKSFLEPLPTPLFQERRDRLLSQLDTRPTAQPSFFFELLLQLLGQSNRQCVHSPILILE